MNAWYNVTLCIYFLTFLNIIKIHFKIVNLIKLITRGGGGGGGLHQNSFEIDFIVVSNIIVLNYIVGGSIVGG